MTDLTADITQNGAESGADLVRLEIRETWSTGPTGPGPAKGEFRFTAADNGKGMSGAVLDRAMDPFVTDGIKHPGRKVGLGIPFLIQTALQSGGGWRISSVKDGERSVRGGGIQGILSGGEGYGNGAPEGNAPKGAGSPELHSGTTVEAWFDLGNVDTPPVGDIPGLFRSVLLFTGPKEIVLKRIRQGTSATAETSVNGLDYEVTKTELEEALGGLEEVASLVLLGKYLKSLEDG